MGKNTMMRRCLINWFEKNPESGFGQFLPSSSRATSASSSAPAASARRARSSSSTSSRPRARPASSPTLMSGFLAEFFDRLRSVADLVLPGPQRRHQDLQGSDRDHQRHLRLQGRRARLPGAASLCNKMDIRPFKFGLIIKHVYDNGNIFDPKVLDLWTTTSPTSSARPSATSPPSPWPSATRPLRPCRTRCPTRSCSASPFSPAPSRPTLREGRARARGASADGGAEGRGGGRRGGGVSASELPAQNGHKGREAHFA